MDDERLFRVENHLFAGEELGATLDPTAAFYDAVDEAAGDDAALLDLSIAKWRVIAAWIEEHHALLHEGGADTCALCAVYWDLTCGGCPIAQDGHPGCGDTPYHEFTLSEDVEVKLRSAYEEIAYLEDLRAKGDET